PFPVPAPGATRARWAPGRRRRRVGAPAPHAHPDRHRIAAPNVSFAIRTGPAGIPRVGIDIARCRQYDAATFIAGTVHASTERTRHENTQTGDRMSRNGCRGIRAMAVLDPQGDTVGPNGRLDVDARARRVVTNVLPAGDRIDVRATASGPHGARW